MTRGIGDGGQEGAGEGGRGKVAWVVRVGEKVRPVVVVVGRGEELRQGLREGALAGSRAEGVVEVDGTWEGERGSRDVESVVGWGRLRAARRAALAEARKKGFVACGVVELVGRCDGDRGSWEVDEGAG